MASSIRDERFTKGGEAMELTNVAETSPSTEAADHRHLPAPFPPRYPTRASSKFNVDLDFLLYLFDLGRAKADKFIENDDIGLRSSTDIVAKFF